MGSTEDRGAAPDRTTTGPPRWVKVSGVVALVVVLIFSVLLSSGRGGDHGPGRHAPPASGHPRP